MKSNPTQFVQSSTESQSKNVCRIAKIPDSSSPTPPSQILTLTESMGGSDASSEKSLRSMVAEAENLLFKDSLDLAETYDLVAFVLTNRDDFKNAFSVNDYVLLLLLLMKNN